MQAHDLDAPYLDTVHEPDGRSRLFFEDDPPISVKDGPPTSGEYGASMPSVTKWASSASAIFLFLFLVLAGVGVALAWRLTDMNKPTVPPEGFAELQQQLKSIAADLSAVRYTLDQQSSAIDQQSAANHDQFTRIQEQISQQSIALLSASPLADKPVRTPPPKPAQHPAHVSTQDSSKPIQVAPPLPPKQ
jgi:hypothetical protein